MNIEPTTQEAPRSRKHTGEICILDHTGDTKLIWDKDNADEVAEMRDLFKRYRKRGYLAYKVTGKDGNKGEQIHDFEPDAGRIIFAPPLVGG